MKRLLKSMFVLLLILSACGQSSEERAVRTAYNELTDNLESGDFDAVFNQMSSNSQRALGRMTSSDADLTLRGQYMTGLAELGWASALRNIDRTQGMQDFVTGATAERAAMDEATYATMSLGEMWGPSGPTREFYEQGSPQERAHAQLVREIGGDVSIKLYEERARFLEANAGAESWQIGSHMQNYLAQEAYGMSYSSITDPVQRQAINAVIYNWDSDVGTRSETNIAAARSAAVEAAGTYEQALTGARRMSASRRRSIDEAYRTYGLTTPEDVSNFEAYAMLRYQRETGVIDAEGQERLEELAAALPDDALEHYHQIMTMAGTTRLEQIQNISGTALLRTVGQIAGRFTEDDLKGFEHAGLSGRSAVEQALLDYEAGTGVGSYTGSNEFLRALSRGELTNEQLDEQFRSGMAAGAKPDSTTRTFLDDLASAFEFYGMGWGETGSEFLAGILSGIDMSDLSRNIKSVTFTSATRADVVTATDDGDETMTFVLEDGEWKLDFEDFMKGAIDEGLAGSGITVDDIIAREIQGDLGMGDTVSGTDFEVGSGSSSVRITNDLGSWDIWYVYVSPSEESQWGQDRLGSSGILSPGNTITVKVAPGTYDIMVTDEDGDTYSRYGVDVGPNGYGWSVTLSDMD